MPFNFVSFAFLENSWRKQQFLPIWQNQLYENFHQGPRILTSIWNARTVIHYRMTPHLRKIYCHSYMYDAALTEACPSFTYVWRGTQCVKGEGGVGAKMTYWKLYWSVEFCNPCLVAVFVKKTLFFIYFRRSILSKLCFRQINFITVS